MPLLLHHDRRRREGARPRRRRRGRHLDPSARRARARRNVWDQLNFESVLAAAQAGGEWALAQLFTEYQPALLRYLRGRAGDDADDVASETWIAAARGLRGFAGDGDAFRAWLFTIARNRLTDERRKSARRPVLAWQQETIEMPALDVSPEEAVVSASAGDEAARRIVALLPADQADVILLRVVGGLSVEEVAAIIGKRPGTVRVLQSRGLERLRKYL